LRPTVKAINKAITGSIAGTVSSSESLPVVYAIADSDTLASTIADTASGDYKMIGLEEGVYDVYVNPRANDFAERVVNGVEVSVGETTEMDTVQVSHN
jgi:hypothetical protein